MARRPAATAALQNREMWREPVWLRYFKRSDRSESEREVSISTADPKQPLVSGTYRIELKLDQR